MKSAPLLNGVDTVSYCGSRTSNGLEQGSGNAKARGLERPNIIHSFILVEAHERRDKFVGHFRKTEQDSERVN